MTHSTSRQEGLGVRLPFSKDTNTPEAQVLLADCCMGSGCGRAPRGQNAAAQEGGEGKIDRCRADALRRTLPLAAGRQATSLERSAC